MTTTNEAHIKRLVEYIEEQSPISEDRAAIAEQLILAGFTMMLGLGRKKKITQWRVNNFAYTAQILMKELVDCVQHN
jgi:hypothetical protein